jgi:hypothetical protein
MLGQIFRKGERFAYQTTVEQPSSQMAAFHVSRAFAHQRDQVALLADHRIIIDLSYIESSFSHF